MSSPYFSILSIFTDLGLLGFIVYCALAVETWKLFAVSSPLDRTLGRMLLLMALVLGLIFTWLEEPAYTVLLAAAVGSLAGSGLRSTSSNQRPRLPQESFAVVQPPQHVPIVGSARMRVGNNTKG